MATTIYMKNSSLTLVTHSFHNNSSDHNCLSEIKKDNDRFVPLPQFVDPLQATRREATGLRQDGQQWAQHASERKQRKGQKKGRARSTS